MNDLLIYPFKTFKTQSSQPNASVHATIKGLRQSTIDESQRYLQRLLVVLDRRSRRDPSCRLRQILMSWAREDSSDT